ncbi:MAG TPA: YicC/YloC family endoribonuclease [Acidobacteriaceae bacterium]|nr:YicC/YloC family endoribonuclease [Acidobacteriaceae bacterium]
MSAPAVVTTPAGPATQSVRSMTGFARVSSRISDVLGITLSLKSVNHRFLDLHLRLPAGMDSLEMQLRRMLKQQLVRGHIEVMLSIDRTQRSETSYDADLIAAYIQTFREIAAKQKLSGEPDLNAIFRLPGVFGAESRAAGGAERGSEEEMQVIEATVLREIGPLVDSLNAMRAQEGVLLAREMLTGLDRLRTLIDEAAGLREDVQKWYFERISQRMIAMLEGGPFDRDRILQEAALIAERSDVDEEVTRLRTHIDHFRAMLEGGGETGKKLDFLMQEMNREANTLLSKTSGVAGNGPRITELGLAMKSEIEKLREQVQNLE